MSLHDIMPVTKQGLEKLREELQHLKTVERPRIIASIAEARAHGDLKENGEYHAAREQQSFMEGRIHEIEAKLANCRVIDVTEFPNEGKIIFGSTVTLLHLDEQTEVTYQIVGEDEADIKQQKISVTSPIARAMMGKFIEDVIEVNTAQGNVSYEIVDVEYK